MSSQSPSIIFGQRISPASEETSASDLQQLVAKVLSILRYRCWLFALPMLTGMAVVLAFCLMGPRQYSLRATFERRDDPVLIKLVAGSPYNFDTLRRSMRFQLIGPGAVEQAVRQLGLVDARKTEAEQTAAARALVARFQPRLGMAVLDTSPNFDLIEVRYAGDEPDLGEKIVNTLKNNYIRDTQHFMINLQKQAQRFFADEVAKRGIHLVRTQAELSQVLMEQPELDPGRPDWLQGRLAAENLALEQLGRQKSEALTEIQAREEYLKQIDVQQKEGKVPSQSSFLTRSLQDPQRGRMEAQIASLASEIADARTIRHMKDSHPYVESLNQKLKQLRADFERLPQTIAGETVNPTAELSPWDSERSRIGMELKTFRNKLDQCEKDLAKHGTTKDDLVAQRATVFERQQRFMLRQQELSNLKSDLSVWQSKLEEINRSMAAENNDRGTRFNTVEECRRPAKPTTPKLSATFIFSGGIGLALGIAAVFLREVFDRSFRNPARVRQILGIPVLETIGEIAVGSSPRRLFRKIVLPMTAGIQVLAILALGSAMYLSLESPELYTRWMSTVGGRLAGLVN